MKISVVIPVYNVEKYLHRCLDSILKQTFKDFEIVCIDDGSTDSSPQILEKYCQKYINLRYYTIKNAGQANARNLGVEYSEGEFICFVDSDDYLSIDMLEKLSNVQFSDDCDMVVCGIDRIFEDGCSFYEKKFSFDAKLEEKHNINIFNYPKLITIINNSPFSKLIRKSILVNDDLKFPTGYIYEDMVFTHKLIATGINVSVITDPLYKYIVRKGSTMTSSKSRVLDMFPMFDLILAYYNKLEIRNQFNDELDYLALYHIGVGTSYRLFKSRQCSFIESIKKSRQYLKKMNCDKRNKYIVQKSFIEKVFIKIFM